MASSTRRLAEDEANSKSSSTVKRTKLNTPVEKKKAATKPSEKVHNCLVPVRAQRPRPEEPFILPKMFRIQLPDDVPPIPETITPHTWPKQEPPIDRLEDVPPELEWRLHDDDIDEDDIDGNLERCEVRIETGIFPQLWRSKRAKYMEMKAAREKMIAKYPVGLSMEVNQRLESLTRVKTMLDKDGDPHKYLENVKALIDAYKKQELIWHSGLVTYWSDGRHIEGPKEWDTEEFLDLKKNHTSIWVEGCVGSSPAEGYYGRTIWPNQGDGTSGMPFHHNVRFKLRIPDSEGGSEMVFLDDTGSSYTMISEADLEEIRMTSFRKDAETEEAPSLGMFPLNTITGVIDVRMVLLTVAIMQAPEVGSQRQLTGWVQLPCMIYPLVPGTAAPWKRARLSGTWWRHMLYTATVPNNKGMIKVSQSKEVLVASIERCDHRCAKAPLPPADNDWERRKFTRNNVVTRFNLDL